MPYPPNVPNGSYGPRVPLPPSFPWGGMMQAPPMIPKLYWDAYSDEQRFKMLWQCFDQMADRVNQLGYYYIPDFRGEWSARQEYPPMSVVEAPSGIGGVTAGDSYTALDWVPAGTPLTDERYWAKTGNYNAQVAELQQTVDGFDARITAATETANNALTEANKKAPINHASAQMTYGTGTSSLFGHVKLSDSPSASDASDGVAVTPKALSDESARLERALNEIFSTKTDLVIIGDSFSATSKNSQCWPTRLPSRYTVHNYSNEGSGFLRAGFKTFAEELDEAVNDNSYNHDAVKAVIIYGGYNDFITSESGASVAAEVASVCETAYENFEGANVICVIGNNGFCSRSAAKGYREWISDVMRQTTSTPKPIVNAYYWLYGFGPGTVFESDQLHPNANGHYFIAQYMNELIDGCFDPSSKWILTGPILQEEGSPEEQDGTVYAMFNPAGEFRLSGQYNFTDTTTGDNFITIGAIADSRFAKYPGNNCLTFPFFGNSMYVVGCYLSPSDGKLHIQCTEGGSTTKSVYW